MANENERNILRENQPNHSIHSDAGDSLMVDRMGDDEDTPRPPRDLYEETGQDLGHLDDQRTLKTGYHDTDTDQPNQTDAVPLDGDQKVAKALGLIDEERIASQNAAPYTKPINPDTQARAGQSVAEDKSADLRGAAGGRMQEISGNIKQATGEVFNSEDLKESGRDDVREGREEHKAP